MLDILNNIGLERISSEEYILNRPISTHVLDFSHNIHFVIHFLIQNPVLHEASLFEFLGGKWSAVELGCDFVYSRKSALTNASNLVVLSASAPFSDIPAYGTQC